MSDPVAEAREAAMKALLGPYPAAIFRDYVFSTLNTLIAAVRAEQDRLTRERDAANERADGMLRRLRDYAGLEHGKYWDTEEGFGRTIANRRKALLEFHEDNMTLRAEVERLREERGYVTNCFLKPRADQDGPMFTERRIARLDGYAIVPRHEYDGLLELAAAIRARGGAA